MKPEEVERWIIELNAPLHSRVTDTHVPQSVIDDEMSLFQAATSQTR